MKHAALILLGSLVACGVAHADARAVRRTAEASMLVTGHVQVKPDGTMQGYTIDHWQALPAPVQALIGKLLPHWTFQPTGSDSQVVDSSMSLRVLARPQDDGSYKLTIAGSSFGGPPDPGEAVALLTRRAPIYPRGAAKAGVSGTVYLLVQVGRDGHVLDAIAEQVNLDQYGTELQMRYFRRLLADASLDAAHAWTFRIPTVGPRAGAPFWVARIPVHFNLGGEGGPGKDLAYGHWQRYIPGPREQAPWAGKRLAEGAPDAVPNGSTQTLGAGLRLKSPMGS